MWYTVKVNYKYNQVGGDVTSTDDIYSTEMDIWGKKAAKEDVEYVKGWLVAHKRTYVSHSITPK